ncbi:MAG: bile acid:sodium symporter family protein, partial [Bacteroidaceae bacterium]|nr:bile acid:sodium symporter family protein [Bacteroidaceae bacterium]
MMKLIFDIAARWMSLMVVAVTAAVLVWPAPFAAIDTWWITPLLGLIMFDMGLTLSTEDLRVVAMRPRDIAAGVVMQYVVMPLTAWALARLLQLPEDVALGVVLVGCCPGGTASNVITYLAKGDLALSVGVTACSTLMAPLVTPLLVWLLVGHSIDVDAGAMMQSIVTIVVLPIVAGLAAQRWL